MPLAGLVVNRATSQPPGELSANAAMAGVERLAAPPTTTTAWPPACYGCTPTGCCWSSGRSG